MTARTKKEKAGDDTRGRSEGKKRDKPPWRGRTSCVYTNKPMPSDRASGPLHRGPGSHAKARGVSSAFAGRHFHCDGFDVTRLHLVADLEPIEERRVIDCHFNRTAWAA